MKPAFSFSVDPRLIEIGFWGKVVFDELLRINVEFGLDGTIPKAFTTLDYLQWRLNLKSSDVDGNEDGQSPRELIREQLAMLGFYGCIQDMGECIVLHTKGGE